ncbi:hypothetical protein INT45_010519 [Circinella minor]|uniref:Integrase catalytic domain-containing protein n=1 Tax=Circinella minor TaxID=1195481 RepID=A0A8H7VPX6_9FUNG|nr:hypothetical protein INT45_010519 [Circinella minor]
MKLPTLAYPSPFLPYDLHVDASDVGLGAVLCQGHRPVAYASRILSPAEQNYTVTERECLAVVWSLLYFHCYIHGTELTIYTDHAALKAILSSNTPRGRIARWVMAIQSYSFTIVHRKGSENLDADALSRSCSSQHTTNDNNEEPELSHITHEELLQHQDQDEEITNFKKEQNNKFFYYNNLFSKAKQLAWWPTLNQDIIEFLRHCTPCQLHKTKTRKYGKMTSIPIGKPCEVWAADIAVLPTTTSGNRYLLVFAEYLTKWVVTAALPSFDSNAIAQILLYEIILEHGVMKKLITDNGTNFISEAMTMVCKRLRISRSTTSVTRPQSDGLVERINRSIKGALAIYVDKTPTTWDRYLPFVTFAINTSKQSSTGKAPFEILYGRAPILPTTAPLVLPSTKTHTTETWISYLNHYLPILHQQVYSNIQKAQERQKKYYDRGRHEGKMFQVGESVLKIKPKETWRFPNPKFTGPWTILKIINNLFTQAPRTEKQDYQSKPRSNL